MYTILGSDGNEYGPVDAAEIRQWLAQGRVNSDTKIRAEGTTEWKRLAELPELAGVTGRPADPVSSPVRSAAAADAVKGPATALMVTAIIGVLLQLVSLLNRRDIPFGLSEDPEGVGRLLSAGSSPVLTVIALAAGAVIFLGAQKMKALESHSWAMLASVVAMVPFVSPCCLIGLPIGIWSILILQKPEVKQAFG